jgi:hypothetical protein
VQCKHWLTKSVGPTDVAKEVASITLRISAGSDARRRAADHLNRHRPVPAAATA